MRCNMIGGVHVSGGELLFPALNSSLV